MHLYSETLQHNSHVKNKSGADISLIHNYKHKKSSINQNILALYHHTDI